MPAVAAPFTCPLPARKGSCVGAALTWCPCTRVLDLGTDRRTRRAYHVCELAAAAEFGGRAFLLTKLVPGTDPEAGRYACLVSHAGPGRDSCECRGFLRWGNCAHLDGLRAVIANDWFVIPAGVAVESEGPPAAVPDDWLVGVGLPENCAGCGF